MPDVNQLLTTEHFHYRKAVPLSSRVQEPLWTRGVATAVLFLLGLFMTSAEAVGHHVKDEWAPIDAIVISTLFNKKTFRHEWNPMTFYTAAVASRNEIKVIVSTTEKSSHEKYLTGLMQMKLSEDGLPVIASKEEVLFVENLMPSDWARDHSPMVVYTNANEVLLRGFNTFPNPADSQQSVAVIARELGISADRSLGFASYSNQKVPLNFEGGNWMTAEAGATLVTTSEAILRHKAGEAANHVVEQAVEKALNEQFGIQRIIPLRPLLKATAHYRLHNTHVDLQVRTLPKNRVIVARVPDHDEQFSILESNAKTLEKAGFEVLRIDNAEKTLPREFETNRRFFKSYTNALFLNRVVLIPSYGDIERDGVAKDLYDNALNRNSKSGEARYTVKQIPVDLARAAIEFSASIRCSAHELHSIQGQGR